MRECPSCGETPPTGSRFCPACGSGLSAGLITPIPSLSFGTIGRRPQVRARVAEIQPVGAVLNGRYRVLRVLGAGSFGRVYLAEDVQDSGSLVAVKELLAMEFPTAEEQHDAMTWFKREVSALLTLDHPGIPAMQGYWTAQRASGPLYLAMDYIPGKTLAEWQIEFSGRVPRIQALEWGIGLCGVLEYLHSRTPPMLFRDLKPSNVLIDTRSKRPVLIDFGLARQLAPVAATAVGTWGYVPFEQVLGRPEPRSDLYALGALLHGMISGQQPDAEYRRLMRGGLDLETSLRQLFQPLEELLPGTSPSLTEVIAHATAFAPKDRFADAAEMAAALQNALENPGGLVMRGPVAGKLDPRDASSDVAEAPLGKRAPMWESAIQRAGNRRRTDSEPENHGSNTAAITPPVEGATRAPEKPPTLPTPAPVLAAEAAALLERSSPPLGRAAGTAGESRPSGPDVAAAEPSPKIANAVGGAGRISPALDAGASGRLLDTGIGTPLPAPPVPGVATLAARTRTPVSFRETAQPAPEARSGTPPRALRRLGASEIARVGAGPIRVSRRAGAEYASLAAAVQAALPGTVIEVEPGLYEEALVIDKDVEIIGLGHASEVIVEAAGATCLLLQAEHAIVRNLTLRGRAPETGSRFHTVNIPVGRVLIEDCHIVSQGLACINTHGQGVNPTLRRLVLRNAVERALVFYDRARALVEECDIQGGTYPVRITGNAEPMFRHCRVHHGRFGGVWVAERGKGEFDDCDIEDNGHHGISIRQGGYALLSHCRVRRNGWNAVSVADSSGARIVHCDLRGNRRSAWDIRDSARRQVQVDDNLEV